MKLNFWETSDQSEQSKIKIGVSACLLGQKVRFDGGHKKNKFLLGVLDDYVEWVPVCPEVEMGMSIPRETIRLVGDSDNPRLIGPKSGSDYSNQMSEWSGSKLDWLASMGLHGFILKKDSPSCGLFRVRVYNDKGIPERQGQGLFARALAERFPLLPMEEEGRLNDLILRESFICRLFTYFRWTQMLERNPTPGGLVQFHTSHRMMLLAHHPALCKQMGKLVAQAGSLPWEELTQKYLVMLMESLVNRTNRKKHRNVIFRLMGFVKGFLSSSEKAEILEVLEDYRRGLVPLIVPLTLMRHHFRCHGMPDWIKQQTYLTPYPKELMLHNYV